MYNLLDNYFKSFQYKKISSYNYCTEGIQTNSSSQINLVPFKRNTDIWQSYESNKL